MTGIESSNESVVVRVDEEGYPDSLRQLVRSFGKVWREFPWLQDELCWATDPESDYQVTYQVESRESIPGVSYLTQPDGVILQMVDL